MYIQSVTKIIKLMMSLGRLVDKIRDEFESNLLIEVYVLDNTGDPYELFSGYSEDLKISHLAVMLKEAGCFYVFSIVGVDKQYADSVNIDIDHIIRKEFCWLTDPCPPEMISRQHDTMVLQWEPVSYCGIDPGSFDSPLQYILEMCEGQEYRPGTNARFISDLNAMSYSMVCKGPELTEAHVSDLKPATWYYWRLTIEYSIGNTCVQSVSKPYPTLKSCPDAPGKPKVHIVPGTKSYQAADGWGDSKVLVQWVAGCSNGSPIDRFQLQVKEFSNMKGQSGSNTGSLASKSPTSDIHKPRSPNYVAAKQQNTTKWLNAYSNIQPECVLPAPRSGIAEWCLRVRARNADGWSPYSNVRIISKYSHPSLFLTYGGYAVENEASHSPYATHSNSRCNSRNSNTYQPEMHATQATGNRMVNPEIKKVKKSGSVDGGDRIHNLMSKSTPNMPPSVMISSANKVDNSKVVVPTAVAGTGARAAKGVKEKPKNKKVTEKTENSKMLGNLNPNSAFSATQNKSKFQSIEDSISGDGNGNGFHYSSRASYENGPSVEELFIERELAL